MVFSKKSQNINKGYDGQETLNACKEEFRRCHYKLSDAVVQWTRLGKEGNNPDRYNRVDKSLDEGADCAEKGMKLFAKLLNFSDILKDFDNIVRETLKRMNLVLKWIEEARSTMDTFIRTNTWMQFENVRCNEPNMEDSLDSMPEDVTNMLWIIEDGVVNYLNSIEENQTSFVLFAKKIGNEDCYNRFLGDLRTERRDFNGMGKYILDALKTYREKTSKYNEILPSVGRAVIANKTTGVGLEGWIVNSLKAIEDKDELHRSISNSYFNQWSF